MDDPTLTTRLIAQGKALVRALESLATIEPSGRAIRPLRAPADATAPGGLQASSAGHCGSGDCVSDGGEIGREGGGRGEDG